MQKQPTEVENVVTSVRGEDMSPDDDLMVCPGRKTEVKLHVYKRRLKDFNFGQKKVCEKTVQNIYSTV